MWPRVLVSSRRRAIACGLTVDISIALSRFGWCNIFEALMDLHVKQSIRLHRNRELLLLERLIRQVFSLIYL